MKKTTILFSFVLALTSVGFIACGSDDSGDNTDTTETPEDTTETPEVGTAQLRVLHLSPDTPAVDVFAGDSMDAAVAGLGFPDTTGFLELDEGEYTFNVTVADAGNEEANRALTVQASLNADDIVTVVALNELANVEALAFAEDFSEVSSGNLRLRIVHAASSVGQVDIWNITDANMPTPLVEDLDFKADTGFVEIPAAAYELGVDVDNDAMPDLTFSIPALPEGTIANVFAVEGSGLSGVQLVAQPSEGDVIVIPSN